MIFDFMIMPASSDAFLKTLKDVQLINIHVITMSVSFERYDPIRLFLLINQGLFYYR